MSLKQVIRGDKEPAHLVVAHRALEAHKARYGEGNKNHPILYSISYRNKHYQVEVTTRRVTMAANIITGARSLGCVHHTA
nr:DUF4060 family protein [Pantoea formicae]